jgi:lipoyl(octanoyl) transferase
VSSFQIQDLGRISYQEAYQIQKETVNRVLKGGPQTVFLCEHPAVLTLGRMAKESHLLASREDLKKQKINVISIDRGGDITLHAPGQLVVYPILDLNGVGRDLRAYLRKLEQVAIDLLDGFGIVASRFLGQTGVWVDDKKIASLGIGVRRWISFHGLAININTDLNLFRLIKPCGLDVEMTSLSALKGQPLDMDEIKTRTLKSFQNVFKMNGERCH